MGGKYLRLNGIERVSTVTLEPREFVTSTSFGTPVQSPLQVLCYFNEVAKCNDFPEFRAHWEALTDFRFTPDQYILILHQVADSWHRHAKKYQQSQFGEDFTFWMRHSVGLWEEWVLPLAPKLSPLHIATALRAYSLLRLVPEPAILEAFETRLQKTASKACIADITDTFAAFSRLGNLPQQETLNTLITRLVDQMCDKRYDPAIDALPLRSMAVFDALKPGAIPSVQAMAALMFEQCAAKSATNREERLQAGQWFGFGPLPELIRQKDSPSNWEGQIREDFARFACKNFNLADAHLPLMGKKTDLCCKDKATGRLVHLEEDGPRHFVLDSDDMLQYDGSTMFHTRLMAKLYPERVFLRLPYTIYDTMSERMGIKTRAMLMQTIIENALKEPAGSTLTVQINANNKFTFAPL